MVIHTCLTRVEIAACCPADVALLDGGEHITTHASRSHPHRFGHVRLCYTGDKPRRRMNRGKLGARADRSATWDEHGAFLAELFDRDPDAKVITYARYEGATDFHTQTGFQYPPAGAF